MMHKYYVSAIGVFLLSFLLQFLLLYNIDLFWEDEIFLDTALSKYEISINHIGSNFFSALLNTKQFYEVKYLDRPLHNFMTSVFVYLFGIDVFMIRAAKIFLFSILSVLMFFFAFRVSNNLLASFLISAYFIVLPENWFINFYAVEALLYANIFTVLAVFTFYFFYCVDTINRYWSIVAGIFIVIFSRVAILIKHQSRTNFFLFSLFLLLTDSKKLLRPKYFVVILVLLSISFPFFGVFSFNESTNLGTHMGINSGNDIFYKFETFFNTLPISFYPHAVFLLISVLILSMALFLSLKNKQNFSNNEIRLLRQAVIFFAVWFILETTVLFIGRKLVFEEHSMMRYYYAYLLFPQTLLLFTFAFFLIRLNRNEKWKVYLNLILVILIFMAVIHNMYRLNHDRGGWGDFAIGWQNVRNYIDSNANNSVLVAPPWTPFFFKQNNSLYTTSDLDNSLYLKNLSRKFSAVYVANQAPFNRSYLNLTTTLTVNDTSAYSKIKSFIGRKSSAHFYVYRFNQKY